MYLTNKKRDRPSNKFSLFFSFGVMRILKRVNITMIRCFKKEGLLFPLLKQRGKKSYSCYYYIKTSKTTDIMVRNNYRGLICKMMIPKEKYEQLHDELEPLRNKITDILIGELVTRNEELQLHTDLVNVISELLRDDNYKMLATFNEEEIEELHKKLSGAKYPYYSVWADCTNDLGFLVSDLKGEFLFRVGKGRSKGKVEYSLNGSSLSILRYKNPNKDLDLKLSKVSKIIIDSSTSKITVQAMDSFGEVMAEWYEYKKTNSVAIDRVALNEYRYEWRSAKK